MRSQPLLSIEPIATMPDARAAALPPVSSASNGPIDLGESVLLLTQIRPSLPPGAGLPSGVVTRTSTPSIGLPTVVGNLPVSSSATVAASVEW